MSADEIRARKISGDSFSTGEQARERDVSKAFFMREIAAQLADLNAILRVISDPAVGISTTLCASNDTIPIMIRER